MDCLKNVLEILYYIAFIILTFLIVKYAKKTYNLESEKKYELLCKLSIRNDNYEKYLIKYALEIYNAGNLVAKNIKVIVNDVEITTVDFIQPNESYLYPIGECVQTMDENIHTLSGIIIKDKGCKLEVILSIDGKEIKYNVSTDILFDSHCNNSSTLKDIENELKNITKAIKAIK